MRYFTPLSDDTPALADTRAFLQAHLDARDRDDPVYLSAGDHRIEVTAQVLHVLDDVVQAMSRGQSVGILALEEEISTQQAAEILGLSRPTVVRLIEAGDLRSRVPGTERRRLPLADVLAYREELRDLRNDFIAESSAEFGDIDPAEVSDLLDEVRRTG